jgi:hypothetical protein
MVFATTSYAAVALKHGYCVVVVEQTSIPPTNAKT